MLYRSKWPSIEVYPAELTGDDMPIALMNEGSVCLVLSKIQLGGYVKVLFDGKFGQVYYYNLEKVDD